MTDAALTQRVLLLDGSSLAYRAFFALPEGITTRTGFPTNALYGLSQMLLKVIAEYRPAGLICAWDAREKTFRHQEYEAYKAQRPEMPAALAQQWERLPLLMDAFAIANVVQPGYEADDILGTLASRAQRDGIDAIIVTGDRDALQAVDEHIRVMTTGRGITDVKIYDRAAVVARYGIEPEQVPDFIGLKGDTSDNIPGVPGVGEKTAAALLQQFGSMDEMYRRLDEVKSPKRRQLLAEHEEVARLSRRLATMTTDVPLSTDAAELLDCLNYEIPLATLDAFFTEYEFASLRGRLKELAARRDVEPAPSVESAPIRVPEEITRHDEAAEVAAAAGARAPLAMVGDEATGELAVAVIAGDRGHVATVAGDEAAGFWRRLPAGAALAHDVKAQPGYLAAPAAVAFDTAVAAYLLTPERPESERTLAALTGASVEAGEGDEADGPATAAGALAGQQQLGEPSAEATISVAERAALTNAARVEQLAASQALALHEFGLEKLFHEVELPLVPVLAQMEATGIRMDPYRLGEITAGLRERIDELADEIQRLAGGAFTIGSPQQLAEVLFGHLGLEPVRKGKTGFSTDAYVLRVLRERHPIIPAIEEWRELTKLLNTYLEPLPQHLNPETGRLHTTFNQLVAATGRLSSSKPNLQNIPVRSALGAEIRACFIADEGTRLIVADYSQIELRLMAHLAGEPALLEAFARGEDVHRVTAAAVAGIAVDAVTKRQRERAKATNFGIMYGLSAFGLSQQVDIGVDEAKAFIDAYFAKYPRVAAFRQRVISEAKADGFVTTIMGRRRALPELHAASYNQRSLGERLAVNTVVQGGAADIIKVAMVHIAREFEQRRLRARLVLQVHDELVVEAPDDELEVCRKLLDETMCAAYPMEPPLQVEIGVGDNWVEAKS